MAMIVMGREMRKTMMSEAQKKASARWDAANTIQVKLKLNKRTDADILQRLSSVPSKQGYIKELIRADITRSGE